MVTNPMVNGRAGGGVRARGPDTVHVDPNALVLSSPSPRRITGLGLDPRKGNLCPSA